MTTVAGAVTDNSNETLKTEKTPPPLSGGGILFR